MESNQKVLLCLGQAIEAVSLAAMSPAPAVVEAGKAIAPLRILLL